MLILTGVSLPISISFSPKRPAKIVIFFGLQYIYATFFRFFRSISEHFSPFSGCFLFFFLMVSAAVSVWLMGNFVSGWVSGGRSGSFREIKEFKEFKEGRELKELRD